MLTRVRIDRLKVSDHGALGRLFTFGVNWYVVVEEFKDGVLGVVVKNSSQQMDDPNETKRFLNDVEVYETDAEEDWKAAHSKRWGEIALIYPAIDGR